MTIKSISRGTADVGEPAWIFVAVELSRTSWLVAVHRPSDGRTGRYKLRSGDADGLLALIDRVRSREERARGGAVRVACCYEAGYDGFWLHRILEASGIACHVMEPASLQVDRRARRAKTDAIDLDGILRALIAFRRGETRVCRMVRVPSVAEEDAKRTHRERKRLVKERVGHVNRIKGLLATQGIYHYQPERVNRRTALELLLGHDGHPLPSALRREIEREIERLELVLKQLRVVEKERDAVLGAAPKDDVMAGAIGHLARLRGIGPETATVLVREIFYRDFENRRQLASYAGLTPTPFMSGAVRRDQTISKSGNPMVRTAMIEIAWLWLRYQPDSALSRWFVERVGDMKGRIRRIAIVAMARKLLVALWRYVNTGLVPTAARLKRA